ncbi:extracellular matrix regulator RemB [Oceanobacillus sp. CAU 1775]
MFIDIGNGNVISSNDIIAIIDYELISSSIILEEMIDKEKADNRLKGPSIQTKSVLITTGDTFYSVLSVATLKKRTIFSTTFSSLDDYNE